MGSGTKNKNHNNIKITMTEAEQKTCQICHKQFESKSAIAGHIGAKHKIKMEDYLIEYFMNGSRHTCPLCGEPTLYKRGTYSFKRYCPDHASYARKMWSKQNGYGSESGPRAGWKKGLTKETDDSVRRQSEKILGKNNPWFGKRHTQETLDHISRLRSNKMRLTEEQYKEKAKELSSRYILHTPYSRYTSVRQSLDVECAQCGTREERSLWALQLFAVCKTCSPSSVQEQAVREFVKCTVESDIKNNIRSLISPQELDIYVPEKKFAIEYNGLYWHSEERKGKSYHLDKTLACREKGIQLFHIFSDEWREKQNIVESMICQRMGLADERIFARKCEVKIVPREEQKQFFDKSHIAGNTRSKITFGLYYEDTLVMAFSLRSPFHRAYRNQGMIEIARMATKINTVVVGGFSKLLKEVTKWAKDEWYAAILTYADLRFGAGNVYSKTGFEHVGDTKLDYWYTDGTKRFNRFDFRAQDDKTEKQVAQDAGVYKVFGCGSAIYVLNIE